MPTGTPSKPPATPLAKPAEKSSVRLQAHMPKIPGVENARRQTEGEQGEQKRKILTLILGTAGILTVMAALYLWTNRLARKAAEAKPSEQAPEVTVPGPVPPPVSVAAPADSDEIASVDELAQPWAAKKFDYVKPFTGEKIPAMAIRLPGGGLWAFSLQEPFGKCALEYITDLGTIAAQYGYTAMHPMVVNPCGKVVYDPLKTGPLGTGAWARGEIVHGEALRPPLSIDVEVQGRSIVAKSME